MNTKIAFTSTDANDNEVTKIITNVNPNADGTALKTFAQGLNSLTTNTYTSTTKVNIDTLTEEASGGSNNPLPAPTIVGIYLDEDTETAQEHVFEVNNATASWTGKLGYYTFGFVTDSTGNLNVTGTPANNAANVGIPSDLATFIDDVGADSLPAAAAAIQNPKYWVLYFSCPNQSDPDCCGAFTCVFNATDTHSSVTVTLNVTEFTLVET